MGVSVGIASFIVLIGFVAVFSTVFTAFFTNMQTLSVTANDYINQQRDKLDTQLQLTVDTVSATSCTVTVRNIGAKTVFLQNSNGYSWNTAILAYGNSEQWHSYPIETYTIQEIRITATNTTFSPANHNFLNPGEQATLTINIPEGAPEIESQNVVSVTFATYNGVTAASEGAMS